MSLAAMEPPKGLDTEDGKLSYCLACHNELCEELGEDVIVCDYCPAAYHAQCAGYGESGDNPGTLVSLNTQGVGQAICRGLWRLA